MKVISQVRVESHCVPCKCSSAAFLTPEPPVKTHTLIWRTLTAINLSILCLEVNRFIVFSYSVLTVTCDYTCELCKCTVEWLTCFFEGGYRSSLAPLVLYSKYCELIPVPVGYFFVVSAAALGQGFVQVLPLFLRRCNSTVLVR